MFVLGTAGHVDHGKSTLVKALTGIDPDRLKEEKEREMTIDLGFAWLQLPGGQELSIVDVPGHERFIKNMLAGVGGIDLALLVVAADEGVMPQTREHLAILDLLGIGRGLVAITKRELVDEDWLALVTEDTRALLQGTSLEGAPILPVSAMTGEGLESLVKSFAHQVEALPPKEDLGRPRLPIDRVFTMQGFGTVVTGTLVDGRLALGQEVEVVPKRLRARVRGLQSHRERIETALPGSRVAINLSGLEREETERGDVVTSTGWLQPARVLNTEVRLVSNPPSPLLHNLTVTFHSGTAETQARVLLLDQRQVLPGREVWAQMLLDRPLPLIRGDFFILRSTQGTLGGGQVVEPLPDRQRAYRSRRRMSPALLQRLEVLRKGSTEDILLTALTSHGSCELRSLLAPTGLSEEQVLQSARTLIDRGAVLNLGRKEVDPSSVLCAEAAWEKLAATVQQILSAYHRQFPLRSGFSREELRSRLHFSSQVFTTVMRRLFQEGAVAEEGASVRLPGHRPMLREEQEKVVRAYLQALEESPYSPPTDVSIHPEILGYLIDEGLVVKSSPEVVFAAASYRQMVNQVIDYLKVHGKITVAEVRDMFRTSRKYALALMEYLDQQHITRRTGDERVLRSDAVLQKSMASLEDE